MWTTLEAASALQSRIEGRRLESSSRRAVGSDFGECEGRSRQRC